MSIDETLTQGVQREENHDHAATMGVVSLAVGLTAAAGGGTLASAFQYWSFELAPMGESSNSVAQTFPAIPAIALGIVAIVLGLVAARSSQTLASATGKAGAITGLLALLGGVAMAVAILSSDIY